MDPNVDREEDPTKMMGGKKKRKEPSVLASWRKFVRKVQHEEKITYPQAMKRASKRKSEWQRGGSPEDDEIVADEQEGGSADAVADFDGQYEQLGKVGGRSRRSKRSRRGGNAMMAAQMGGSRRRRGTKKRRGSRRR